MPRADGPYGLPDLRSASCRRAESSEVTLAFMNLKANKLSGWSSVGKEQRRFFAAPSLNQYRGRGEGAAGTVRFLLIYRTVTIFPV